MEKQKVETMCVEGSIIVSLGDKSSGTLNILLNRMKVYIFCHQLNEYMVNSSRGEKRDSRTPIYSLCTPFVLQKF